MPGRCRTAGGSSPSARRPAPAAPEHDGARDDQAVHPAGGGGLCGAVSVGVPKARPTMAAGTSCASSAPAGPAAAPPRPPPWRATGRSPSAGARSPAREVPQSASAVRRPAPPALPARCLRRRLPWRRRSPPSAPTSPANPTCAAPYRHRSHPRRQATTGGAGHGASRSVGTPALPLWSRPRIPWPSHQAILLPPQVARLGLLLGRNPGIDTAFLAAYP